MMRKNIGYKYREFVVKDYGKGDHLSSSWKGEANQKPKSIKQHPGSIVSPIGRSTGSNSRSVLPGGSKLPFHPSRACGGTERLDILVTPRRCRLLAYTGNKGKQGRGRNACDVGNKKAASILPSP